MKRKFISLTMVFIFILSSLPIINSLAESTNYLELKNEESISFSLNARKVYTNVYIIKAKNDTVILAQLDSQNEKAKAFIYDNVNKLKQDIISERPTVGNACSSVISDANPSGGMIYSIESAAADEYYVVFYNEDYSDSADIQFTAYFDPLAEAPVTSAVESTASDSSSDVNSIASESSSPIYSSETEPTTSSEVTSQTTQDGFIIKPLTLHTPTSLNVEMDESEFKNGRMSKTIYSVEMKAGQILSLQDISPNSCDLAIYDSLDNLKADYALEPKGMPKKDNAVANISNPNTDSKDQYWGKYSVDKTKAGTYYIALYNTAYVYSSLGSIDFTPYAVTPNTNLSLATAKVINFSLNAKSTVKYTGDGEGAVFYKFTVTDKAYFKAIPNGDERITLLNSSNEQLLQFSKDTTLSATTDYTVLDKGTYYLGCQNTLATDYTFALDCKDFKDIKSLKFAKSAYSVSADKSINLSVNANPTSFESGIYFSLDKKPSKGNYTSKTTTYKFSSTVVGSHTVYAVTSEGIIASCTINVLPVAPKISSISSVGSKNSIKIKWYSPSSGATGYKLYIKSGKKYKIKSSGKIKADGSYSYCTAKKLKANKTYTFKLKLTYGKLQSGFTSPFKAITAPKTAPKIKSLSAGGSSYTPPRSEIVKYTTGDWDVRHYGNVTGAPVKIKYTKPKGCNYCEYLGYKIISNHINWSCSGKLTYSKKAKICIRGVKVLNKYNAVAYTPFSKYKSVTIKKV